MKEAAGDSASHGQERSRLQDRFDAAILDLDGVVTDTATLHRAAWKQTFDEFLRSVDPPQPPFDEEQDYLRYVDGMPRYDGVRSFLASRGIELPEGGDDDTVDDQTVRGIGNSKNERFRNLLRERGAEVFRDAVDRIRQWKRQGLATAVVSSSRNCRCILESAGLTDLFDFRVDGETADELGLEGKPAPDIFEEAARRLGVGPRRVLVIEDAIAGVEAARRGGFGLIIGIDRSGDQGSQLREHGADVVVHSLEEWDENVQPRRDDPPRRLLDEHEKFMKQMENRTPVVFLDYDGTLTPIVERPDLAIMDESMRAAVRRLAALCTVAVVSGRDRKDVEKRVGLDNILYAGSHGFDIRGPEDLKIEHEVGNESIPRLDDVERQLHAALDGVDGAQVERKKFSIAVHYRNVADADAPRVEDAVDRTVRTHEGLRKSRGKKVFEIQPDLEWDKGRAVLWLLETLELDDDAVIPIYIGDDVTDEDAFKALHRRGIGIVVAADASRSAAHYRLENVDEVREFLKWLGDQLQRAKET